MNNFEIAVDQSQLETMLRLFQQATEDERMIMIQYNDFAPLFVWRNEPGIDWVQAFLDMLELLKVSDQQSLLYQEPFPLLRRLFQEEKDEEAFLLEALLQTVVPKEKQTIVVDYYLDHLFDKTRLSEQLQRVFLLKMLKIAQTGHMIKFINALGPNLMKTLIIHDCYDILQALYDKCPESHKRMLVQSLNHKDFSLMVFLSDLNFIGFFFQKLPQSRWSELLENENFLPLHKLVSNKNTTNMAYLLERMTVLQKERFFRSRHCEALALSLHYNDDSLLQLLLSHASSCVKKYLISYKNFHFYQNVANKEKQYSLNHILMNAGRELREAMIEAQDFMVVRTAARQNHYEILHIILSYMSADQKEQLVSSNNCQIIEETLAQNNPLGLHILFSHLHPSSREELIAADDFYLYREAVRLNHIAFFKMLMRYASNEQKYAMLSWQDYHTFCTAIAGATPAMIQQIILNASFVLQDRLIAAHDYYAVRICYERGLDELWLMLLEIPATFDYVIDNFEDFYDDIGHLVSTKVRQLLKEGVLFNTGTYDPERLFQLCYQLARYSIIARSERSLVDFHMLLIYPLFSARVATQGNKLFLMSLRYGNHKVQQILWAFDTVRELAIQNNYYQGATHFEHIVSNKESAMPALTPEEEAQLQHARTYYGPEITEKGVETLLEELRALLRQRYLAEPATIQSSTGAALSLPLEPENAFLLSQQLPVVDYNNMLKAYYQHPIHTLYRFLLEDNPWLACDAEHIHVTDEGCRQSLFKEYAELIALVFLAAKDPNVQGEDGISSEDRFTLWVIQMGDLARAHNRENTGAGSCVDNLLPDNPSCLKGMKKRIFSSVIGHPFFKIMTKELLDAYAIERQTEYFQSQITPENAQELLDALLATEDYPLEKDIAILRQLNLPSSIKEQIKQEIVQKFQHQFDLNPALLEHLTRRLTSAPHINCDAIEFGSKVNLKALLKKKITAAQLAMNEQLHFSNKENSPPFKRRKKFN